MKNAIWIGLLLLCMAGCGAEPVYETIGNVWDNEQTVHSPSVIEFALPEDAQMEVLGNTDTGAVYQIGQWTLWTQVLEGGDVPRSMETLSGLKKDRLQIISHPLGSYSCYEAVWSAAEEEGETLVRTAVIPYGPYHYCLSLKAPAEQGEQAGGLFSGILENVYLNDTTP